MGLLAKWKRAPRHSRLRRELHDSMPYDEPPDLPQSPELPRRAPEAVAERIRSGRKIVTSAAAVLLGLVFLAELATGVLADPVRLWILGANSFGLLMQGQWFRLATANLLHGNLLHVLGNVVFLVGLGVFLEPLLGSGRFLTVLLVSALVGTAGSAILGDQDLSLGASTAVAGLIGAYVAIWLRQPDRLAPPPTPVIWLAFAFALIWPAQVFEHVDHRAHLAGFFAGFVMMSLDIQSVDLGELAGRRRALYQITAALLVALFGVAGWIAVQHVKDAERRFGDAALISGDFFLPATVRNSMAWHIATSPDASRSHLQSTQVGIWRVTESEPENAVFRDTLATVRYRLGQWEEAVLTEREAFATDPTPFHASQLARFEWALLQARGPLYMAQPPPKVFPRAGIVSGPAILLDTGDPQLPPGAVVHLVLASQGKPSALLEVTIGAPATARLFQYPLPSDLPVDQVAVALVDPQATDEPAETRWDLQPMVPEAARLP